MSDPLYCDCEIGEEAFTLHERGWVYLPNGSPHKSECLKCKDTGVIPTVYCTCSRGAFRHGLDLGSPIRVVPREECPICLGGGVVPGGTESWSEGRSEEQTTKGNVTYFKTKRVIQRVVTPPERPVEQHTSLGLARLQVKARDMVFQAEKDGIVDFTARKAARDLEEDLEEGLPVATAEVVWGPRSFHAAFSICKDDEWGEFALVPPTTNVERTAVLRHLRWVINYQAHIWGLPRIIREEDWGGDPRG